MQKKSLQSFLLSILLLGSFISIDLYASSSDASCSLDPLEEALDCIEINDLCSLHELIKMNRLDTQYLLKCAFYYENLNVITFLMSEYGASPFKKNKSNFKPIDYCTSKSIKKEVYYSRLGQALLHHHKKTNSNKANQLNMTANLFYHLCSCREFYSDIESRSEFFTTPTSSSEEDTK